MACMDRLCVSVCLAAVLSVHGYSTGSLSSSGAVASAAIGVLHMGTRYTFGLVLICFYLTSSKLTKLRQCRKSRLDAHFKLNGQRSAMQVLCNSAGGGIAAAAACITPLLHLQQEQVALLQLAAWAAFLAHYACCCADTWASELGMAYSQVPPRLITTLKPVPAGVNGAVTALGLAASAAGGMFMGTVLCSIGWMTGELQPLVPLIYKLMLSACTWVQVPQQQQQQQLADAYSKAFVFWLVLGLCAGLAGSLCDSVLGATLQYSGYCHKTNKVVGRAGEHVVHISGMDCLSNEAVNAAAAAVTALGVGGGIWWLVVSRA